MIRPARPDDYPAFAALFRELGATADPTPSEARFRDDMMANTFVATDEADAVLGYVQFDLLAEGAGYVRQLVVDRRARKSGLGKSLMHRVAQRCHEAGGRSWCLNVRPDNVAARGLYAALGLTDAHRNTALRLAWASVEGVARPRGVAAVVAPGDYAAFEQSLGIDPGILRSRDAGARVVLGVRSDAGEPLGCAAFDPDFPGASPFRAVELGVARALLDAMRPYGRAEYDFVRVVIEDDEGLARALVGAGAEIVMLSIHMVGPLPAVG
ncbi:MAG TPA: GNAT family N-acetyltransferase [Polyangiaceae bacterium]